jgi:ATP/maltotriose-dependent transcriptional regulator MalT
MSALFWVPGKTHIAAIYRKLPATRRREALMRARELELI